MKRTSIILFLLFLFYGKEINAALPTGKVEYAKYTVFCAGDDNVNSYRIPSVITAKNGALLVFCEARRESWKDKSRTDIVVKRSEDDGKTWSIMQDLTKGISGAYMDPTPLVDYVTGRIFLFTTFWPAEDHSGVNNKAFLITSDDNGKTWNSPKDVTSVLIPKGKAVNGFGPGAGLQMQGKEYKGRLILPTRIYNINEKVTRDVAVFSDDHGKSWTVGGRGDNGDEFQIAESPNGTLVYNARVPGGRMVARSTDGGRTWGKARVDSGLPGVSKGCQASIYGRDNILYFSGIQGIKETLDEDERARLTLYKSVDGGKRWDDGLLLYEKASGYSCITFLPDGRMAIIFETADSDAFTRKSIPNTKPLKRPAGWMRLDLIILSTY